MYGNTTGSQSCHDPRPVHASLLPHLRVDHPLVTELAPWSAGLMCTSASNLAACPDTVRYQLVDAVCVLGASMCCNFHPWLMLLV